MAGAILLPILFSFSAPPVHADELAFGDRLIWRVGMISGGLFSSQQARPVFYFDTGFQLKDSPVYLDLQLPSTIAGMDWLLLQAQRRLSVANETFVFDLLNDPDHYGAFMELGSLRIGQGFRSGPWRFGVGLASSFDFVFFQRVILASDNVTDRDLRSADALDPFVLGVGGFGAIGWRDDIVQWDMSFAVMQDVFTQGDYEPISGQLASLENHVLFALSDDIGVYLRLRISYYNHVTNSRIVTLMASWGAALNIW